MDLHALGSIAIGAIVTTAAGAVGAGTGHAIDPSGSLTAIVGAVTAIGAAMAWVDHRIDRRLADYRVVDDARANERDKALLLQVKEMLDRE